MYLKIFWIVPYARNSSKKVIAVNFLSCGYYVSITANLQVLFRITHPIEGTRWS